MVAVKRLIDEIFIKFVVVTLSLFLGFVVSVPVSIQWTFVLGCPYGLSVFIVATLLVAFIAYSVLNDW